MEVRLSPDSQARLVHFASESGCNANTLADEIVRKYFEKLERFEAAVLEGEAALDRGEYITHEDLKAEIKEWFKG